MIQNSKANHRVSADWQQAAVASTQGVSCRACGETSAANPYLRPDAMPAITGQDQATWFRNCDAWWRGWDGEDARLAGVLHAVSAASPRSFDAEAM
jgi:hypothetical protein